MAFFGLALVAIVLQCSLAQNHHGAGHNDSKIGDMGYSEDLVKEDADNHDLLSYADLGMHRTTILMHIILMVLAWFLVLPIGTMASIVRSRLALPAQLSFIVLNTLGILFGTIYNANTADLYVNNTHHKLGWVVTGIMVIQTTISILLANNPRRQNHHAVQDGERTSFLPVPATATAQQDFGLSLYYCDHDEIDHGSQQSPLLDNISHYSLQSIQLQEAFMDCGRLGLEAAEDDDEPIVLQSHSPPTSSSTPLRIGLIAKRIPAKLRDVLHNWVLPVIEVMYDVIDRTILLLGFVALTTGGVTYTGILRGDHLFNGLAHFIKGAIFFWYGLLTLGRWIGCFANLGWAWNVKPSTIRGWRAIIPSASFTESFVIWLYGASNVWLEHFAAWGGEWTAQDLEHVSTSVLFFGGGLCGMLVESRFTHKCRYPTVDITATHRELEPNAMYPKQFSPHINPIPALMILLLGIIMSSHHQNSVVSTMIHAQWGYLLIGFSFTRIATCILMYLSPPTSVCASRPPSELIASFCLVSGGLLLMASTKDIISYMERANLMATFTFTITMALSAFIMAYEMIVLSFAEWAARREVNSLGRQ